MPVLLRAMTRLVCCEKGLLLLKKNKKQKKTPSVFLLTETGHKISYPEFITLLHSLYKSCLVQL